MAGFQQNPIYPGWMKPSDEPPSLLEPHDLAVARRSAELKLSCKAVGASSTACKHAHEDVVQLSSVSGSVAGRESYQPQGLLVLAFVGATCAVLGFAAGSAFRSRRVAPEMDMGYLRVA